MSIFMRSLILVAAVFLGPIACGYGAHFSLDEGRVVLRQLQYCTQCGSALLVTNVHSGSLVRCPDCGHEQARLQNDYILNQMYQLCKTCQGPINPEGHQPGDMAECENCHTRQPLSRDAFALRKIKNGPGFAPGHPPGTAKKTLLLAPQKPDTLLSMIPLETTDDLPLPPHLAREKTVVPEPPASFAAQRKTGSEPAPAPLPEPGDDEPRTLVIREQVVRKTAPAEAQQAGAGPAPGQPVIMTPSAAAIDVPAVSADLFGGKRLSPASRQTGTGGGAQDQIVARVNGEPIYKRDIDRVLDPVLERMRARAAQEEQELITRREQQLRTEILDRLIDRELVVREAAAMGYVPDSALIRNRENELAQIITSPGVNLRREAMRDITMSDVRRRFNKPGAATPAAVREFYQKHKDQLVQPRRIALDQLVVYEDRTDRSDKRDYRDIALEIAASLEQGSRFDDLRSKYDEFIPAAGVPYQPPALLPEAAFSRQVLLAAGELRRGAVFGPVFLSGMVLFGKVTDERKEGPVPFEEVEKDIRRTLEEEETEKSFTDWIRQLRAKARIDRVG